LPNKLKVLAAAEALVLPTKGYDIVATVKAKEYVASTPGAPTRPIV
jgi:hypothetical protein